MSVRHLVVAMALALAACGDATGPKNLTGSWQYMANSLSSGLGPACNIVDLTLKLTHSGSMLTGRTSGGRAECAGLNFPTALPENMQLGNGMVVGDSVYFNIASDSWKHAAVASGSSIRGTATMRIMKDSVLVVLTGPFTAVKR